MSISANQLYEEILSAGPIEDEIAYLFLEQGLESCIGHPLHAEEVMDELMSMHDWPEETQTQIRSVLYAYEGQRVVVFSHNMQSVSELISQTAAHTQAHSDPGRGAHCMEDR